MDPPSEKFLVAPLTHIVEQLSSRRFLLGDTWDGLDATDEILGRKHSKT